jgi:hypothetical protein
MIIKILGLFFGVTNQDKYKKIFQPTVIGVDVNNKIISEIYEIENIYKVIPFLEGKVEFIPPNFNSPSSSIYTKECYSIGLIGLFSTMAITRIMEGEITDYKDLMNFIDC